MVSSPVIVYASFFVKQAITGIGDGLTPVLFLVLSICPSVIGVIGLAMKGLLFVKERFSGNAQLLVVVRSVAVVMIVVFGFFAAYLLWSSGQIWTTGRLLLSVVAVVGFVGALYTLGRLWR
jgi:hypothetical protein